LASGEGRTTEYPWEQRVTDEPYNPLEKANLARSIQSELLGRDPIALTSIDSIKGAGIYVLYYIGSFAPYAPIKKANAGGKFAQPIYIGKAIPRGGRKGGVSADASKGTAMRDRLRQHSKSIDEVDNLEVDDFTVRYMMVDDIWIPLGENILIEQFKPLWNSVIDGFGNKDTGIRRSAQHRSPWDVLHSGRKVAEKNAEAAGLTRAFLAERIGNYFAGRPLKALPKAVVKEQDEAENDALDAADES
jgi:hypothetical protein